MVSKRAKACFSARVSLPVPRERAGRGQQDLEDRQGCPKVQAVLIVPELDPPHDPVDAVCQRIEKGHGVGAPRGEGGGVDILPAEFPRLFSSGHHAGIRDEEPVALLGGVGEERAENADAEEQGNERELSGGYEQQEDHDPHEQED